MAAWRRGAALVALLVSGGSVATVSPSAAQTTAWGPQDRVVISDFSRLTTVAAASDRIYVTSPTSLLVWQPQLRRWEGPFQPPSGALTGVISALVDPLDNSLWLARRDGWVRFVSDGSRWETGRVTGPVLELAFDLDQPGSGALLRTPKGWLAVQRDGSGARPAAAPSRAFGPVPLAEARRAGGAAVGDAVVAAAPAFDRRGWYFATDGRGLLYLPEGAAQPEVLSFGLAGDSVGAVATMPGGIWAAARGRPEGTELTYLSADLSEMRVLDGPAGFAGSAVDRLAALEPLLWAASGAGVTQFDLSTGRSQLFDDRRGLPDHQVKALTPWQGGVAVGTARGIAVLLPEGRLVRVAAKYQAEATALLARGDTLWVGTPSGVQAAVVGLDNLARPRGGSASASGAALPILALASRADTLVALTSDRVLWRDPRTGVWAGGGTLARSVGAATTLIASPLGVWIAGERGVALGGAAREPALVIRAAALPGPVTGLAVDAEYLWTATPAGLVRWRLAAVTK
jgi:hypothetical protein